MKKSFLMALVAGLAFSFSAYSDTFEGKGKGFGGEIVIDAEITDNKIMSVTVKEESESDFAKPAIKEISDKIIETQDLKVDDVSGATATSKGIKRAISNAVKASGATLTKIQ